MFGLRIAKGERERCDPDKTRWRIVAIRLTPRLPYFGSVSLRTIRRLTPPKAAAPEVAKVRSEIRRRKRLGRMIGLFALLVLALAVWMGVNGQSFVCVQPQPCLPGGFGGHVLALEFARTTADIQAIAGDVGHPNRKVMRRQLYIDFGFIASYLVLYLLLAALLERTTRDLPLLTVLAIVGALCTAGFDVLENVRALKVLATPPSNLDDATVANILDASVIKWTFSFVTIALLSFAFPYGQRATNTLRALFILTAVAGMLGLAVHRLMWVSSVPLLLGLLFLTFDGLSRPLRLIPASCGIRPRPGRVSG